MWSGSLQYIWTYPTLHTRLDTLRTTMQFQEKQTFLQCSTMQQRKEPGFVPNTVLRIENDVSITHSDSRCDGKSYKATKGFPPPNSYIVEHYMFSTQDS